MSDFTPTEADPAGPYSYPNLTTKELDRDIVNLFLPEIDLLAQPGELERLYSPGFWDDLLAPDA
ncbi:hypothetical protein [Hymenobacter arcticus]